MQVLHIFFILLWLSIFFNPFIMLPRVNQAPIRLSNGNVDFVYYIHQSKGPSSVKLKSLLNGSNYLWWSRSCAKNKLSFVDRFIQVPKILDLNRATWEGWIYLVHSWILNFVTEPMGQTIVLLENALNVWIKERFFIANRIVGSSI